MTPKIKPINDEYFISEHAIDYESYTFSYSLYKKYHPTKDLLEYYDQGFLPYSGDKVFMENSVFYMARSTRVALKDFTCSSENRRILKKFSKDYFSISQKRASECLHDKEFLDFCLYYFSNKHGERIMSLDRLQRILGMFSETMVTCYRDSAGRLRAGVIEVQVEKIAHYWFSCFDLSQEYSSLGMWLMLNHVLFAQESNKEFIYLGTLYGEKALYKTNIPSISFWNGVSWIEDTPRLKKRARSDHHREVSFSDECKE